MMLIQDVLTYTTILHSEMKTSVVDLDTLVRQVIQTYPLVAHREARKLKLKGCCQRSWVIPRRSRNASPIF